MSDTAETGRSLVIAAVILLGVEVVIALVAVAVWRRKQKSEAWDLVPVVVAADPMAPGTVLTYDLISQRSVPEMFVTASVVRPDDAARVIGKAVQVPIQPGDPIRWSDVAAADGGPGAGPE